MIIGRCRGTGEAEAANRRLVTWLWGSERETTELRIEFYHVTLNSFVRLLSLSHPPL